MNTADLHPKRFDFALPVAALRRLTEELLTMEHAPHQAPVPADKQIERDRAGEQLLTHLSALLADSRGQDETTPIRDSLPLLRTSAKYLLTAADRCRRSALLRAHQADGPHAQAAREEVAVWDQMMRRLSEQHGVSAPLRELVEAVPLTQAELQKLGLDKGALFNEDELLARF